MISPLISVVTVVYNGSKYIEDTILSIINQDYKNIQYIIIDGGSTDSTIEIVNKYMDYVDLFISEPDYGIYHAMNKSLLFCKGQWVNFMNVGDYFYNNSVISDIFNENLNLNSDIIYGNHQVLYSNSIVNKYPSNLKYLWKGMTIQHQSIFVSQKVYKKFSFNINYQFAADFDLIFRCKNYGYKFFYYPKFFSIISANGFSERNSYLTYLEFKEISLGYDFNIFHRIFFAILLPYRKIIFFTRIYIRRLIIFLDF
jgi:glycosyltransferase involved in cell wall biosynthesis